MTACPPLSSPRMLDAMGNRLGNVGFSPERLRGDLALPDDPHPPAAPGAFDPVLARSLRHVDRQGRQPRARCSARTPCSGIARPGRLQSPPTRRSAKTRRCSTWLDATANRRAKPQRELRSRGHGTVQPRPGPITPKATSARPPEPSPAGSSQGDRFAEIPAQHDDGEKTILGRTGKFSRRRRPDASLLGQAACAEFLSPQALSPLHQRGRSSPTDALDRPRWRSVLRASGYDISSATVGTILRSNLFHDPAIRRKRVKSPIEFTVGAIRALEALRPTVAADALGLKPARGWARRFLCPPKRGGLGRRPRLDQHDCPDRPD